MKWLRGRTPVRGTPSITSSWRESRFLVVDLETTGLNPRRDHIISYGGVPVIAGRFRPADAFYGLVSSPVPVPGRSACVHSLRDQDLHDAPPLADCVGVLDRHLRGAVLVAHAADIERAFLARAFQAHGGLFNCPIVDTASLLRTLFGTPFPSWSRSLEECAEHFGLPVQTPHHALGDALTTATLFLAVVAKLEQRQPVTVSTLLALSDARMS